MTLRAIVAMLTAFGVKCPYPFLITGTTGGQWWVTGPDDVERNHDYVVVNVRRFE